MTLTDLDPLRPAKPGTPPPHGPEAWRPRTRADLVAAADIAPSIGVRLLLWTEWLLWPLGVHSPRTAAVVLWLATTTVIAGATVVAALTIL